MSQKDLFGYEASQKIERKKKQVDPQIADFKKRNGAYLSGYVMFALREMVESPPAPEGHTLLTFTECQKRITTMCCAYGMTPTVASEGIVASGNGVYLYMLQVYKP